MVEFGRVLAVVCAVLGMTMSPARAGCAWTAELLPLPGNAFSGRVTGGDGAWLSGVAGEQAVLWRDGRLAAAGRAFGLPTELLAVNGKGVAVGTVLGRDGRQHAVRYAGAYEYLPGATATDVNDNGTAVGVDGSSLLVWPPTGPARTLPLPTGAGPFGQPSIDDDGTVVARVGWVADQKLTSRVYAWAQDGTRTPIPMSEAEDVTNGRIVGTSEDLAAIGWSSGKPRLYRGGTRAVAVNDSGVAVGTDASGTPLLWSGPEPVSLPTPADFYPASVTAINDHDAGGFASPLEDLGTLPVRWRCS